MHRVTNIPLLRKSNVNTIFNIIWQKKRVTRKELCQLSSLTAPPVSNIINHLMEQGFVKITGKGDSRGGRQPDIIEFISDAYHVIGISIGVYRIKGIIADLYCNKIMEYETATHRKNYSNDILPVVKKVVEKLFQNFNQKKILAIGVSFAGSIDSESGVILNSPIIGDFTGVNLKTYIEKNFGVKAYTGNNANLAALNEYWFGKGRGHDFVLFIYAGYGIGSGLIINGEIYTGSDHAAGEVGHTIMLVNGSRCYCGSYGCLETIASYPALLHKFQKKSDHSGQRSGTEFSDVYCTIANVEKMFTLARQGNTTAIAVLRDIGRYIGIATANMLNILNPDIVIFGGEYLKIKSIIISTIEEMVKVRAWPVVKNTELTFTDYGLDADLNGAATLAIRKILDYGYESFIA